MRVLEFGEIRPVGATRTKMVDVRVIAATNRDLRDAIARGEFREDLYYRLATFQIEAPPLRARVEDVPILASAFLASAAVKTGRDLAFDQAALDCLAGKTWAGNARELQNAVTRLSVLAPTGTITGADVEDMVFGHVPSASARLPSLHLADLERLAVEAALARHAGDRAGAAKELSVSVRTLYNKVKEYGL
ncbi:MAG: sigma 54-interacting transcriptional regulator [Thermoanaerobaculia bacterium]